VNKWSQHDSWFMIHDSWFMIHDSWFMIHDSWFMIHDSWFMINMFICVHTLIYYYIVYIHICINMLLWISDHNMIHDSCFVIHVLWFMIHVLWFMIHVFLFFEKHVYLCSYHYTLLYSIYTHNYKHVICE